MIKTDGIPTIAWSEPLLTPAAPRKATLVELAFEVEAIDKTRPGWLTKYTQALGELYARVGTLLDGDA